MRRPLPVALAVFALALLVVPIGPSPAEAKLSSKEWKETETLFKQLFAERGNAKGKAAVLEKILEDGTGRAWRTLSQALLLEVQLWTAILAELHQASVEHGELMKKGVKGGWTLEDEGRLKKIQPLLKLLEADAKLESEAIGSVVAVINKGPEALRKIILQRAKSGDEWPYRAAAIRVAVASRGEKTSQDFLNKTLSGDKDPRVRMAGLDALAGAEADWENLVLGRLGDPDWGVMLKAVQILTAREVKSSVPHLINALSIATPRVAEDIGKALRTLTGENFEPYADVWSKWWEDNKTEFNDKVKVKKGGTNEFANVHVYGVPIQSDHVLFIIDISGSMKLPTKNDNPMDRWKPPPTVTGSNKPPPPPPPPEEILSGPKIEVAKHELKKAIKKLPKHWKFNIIKFNHACTPWRQQMVEAKDKVKEEAYQWIRALKPSGSTYIDGALRMGFRMGGLVNFDKRYPEVSLDTIVLICDGAPTDNGFPVSKLMEPEEILGHVREWNKDKKVIIHCIGVDMVEGIQFLRDLAKENGGTYVDR